MARWLVGAKLINYRASWQLVGDRKLIPSISGEHSDQGSMISEICQDIRSRKKISEHSDRALAQNFDAVLAVVVI